MKTTKPIAQFRSDTESVEAWRAVLAMPITQTVLSLLRDNGPQYVQPKYGLTEIDIARRYGHVGGYAEYDRLLEEMSEPWPLPKTAIEETYEEERP